MHPMGRQTLLSLATLEVSLLISVVTLRKEMILLGGNILGIAVYQTNI